mgnify:CR=1 FL=1
MHGDTGVVTTGFGARYLDAVVRRGRFCAGIDPHAGLLTDWGLTVDAAGLSRFADICIEALGPVAAVIKPQVAFFEPFGSAGFAVLERVIAGCREHGALVLADAKRGDIGSTMAAYSTAWLDDSSPLCSDAVTISPYLGFESLRPAIDAAHAAGRGVFVLARTSNPEGGQVQTASVPGGRIVAQSIVDDAAADRAGGARLGDRVAVMTPGPGRVRRIVDIPIPRADRTWARLGTDPSFAALRETLLTLVRPAPVADGHAVASA